MGKGGGSAPTIKIGPLEKEQAAFLKSQRQNIIEPGQAALFQPALMAATQAFNTSLSPRDRQALEGQYNQARSSILQGGARGGLMRQMLSNADIARAESVGNAINQARQLGIERGLGLLGPATFPGASTIVGGGNAAAQSEAQRRAANAQMAAQSQAAAGQGKGSAIGGLGALGAGAMMMMSSKKFKDHVEPVDVDAMLVDLEALPLNSWRYKGDDKTFIGPMVEDSPEYITTGDAIEVYNYIGLLMGSLKALAARVRELEAR